MPNVAERFAVLGGSPPEVQPRLPNALVGRGVVFAEFNKNWDKAPSKAVETLAHALQVSLPGSCVPECDLAGVLRSAEVVEAIREDYERPETPDE